MKKEKNINAFPKSKELKSVLDEIQSLAKQIVKDFAQNPSQLSGSMIQIHEKSPLLSKKTKKS